jgi:hypothetical protein
MSSPELRIKYTPDDQWFGELEATVLSGDFSGKARAWFNLETLRAFLSGLRKFPLDQSDLPTIEGNYDSVSTQPDVRIAMIPHDALGLLRVQVDLVNTSLNPGKQSVTTQFFTEYGLLANFATELAAMLDGKRAVAVLTGRGKLGSE